MATDLKVAARPASNLYGMSPRRSLVVLALAVAVGSSVLPAQASHSEVPCEAATTISSIAGGAATCQIDLGCSVYSTHDCTFRPPTVQVSALGRARGNIQVRMGADSWAHAGACSGVLRCTGIGASTITVRRGLVAAVLCTGFSEAAADVRVACSIGP